MKFRIRKSYELSYLESFDGKKYQRVGIYVNEVPTKQRKKLLADIEQDWALTPIDEILFYPGTVTLQKKVNEVFRITVQAKNGRTITVFGEDVEKMTTAVLYLLKLSQKD